MNFKPITSIGKIILIPETDEQPSMMYCVGIDPRETLWADGVIYLYKIQYGDAYRSWHLQHKSGFVNFLSVPLRLTPEHFSSFTIVDEIPLENIPALEDAWNYADIKKNSL